ncbi:MAG: S-layer protein [Gemmatimonadetes bacterium]|nr:S-layer protein [Gemmatimonadota bacterium]
MLLAACSAEQTGPLVESTAESLAVEVRTAPTAQSIAGQSVLLETQLWRDFQPVAPPDGQPLIVVARVRTSDGSALAPGLRADSVWVMFGEKAWSTRAVQEQPRASTASYLEVVARDGPKWGPGVSVDVVVRVMDGSGRPVYVRAANQRINRTD